MELSLHGGAVLGEAVFFHNFGDWRLTDYLFYWSMAKAGFSVGPNARLKLQTYYSHVSVDQFYRTRISAYNIWIADAPDNTPLSSNLDGKIQFDWEIFENLLLVSGANIRYTSVDWEKVFLSPYDEIRGAGFLQVQWRPWDEVQLTGGLRLDLNTLTDSALSPRFVAVLLPWKRHSFRLGYGIAFRKPSAYETKAHTVIEVFNPATPEIVDLAETQLGNEDLRNEKVHSFEAGWRANFLDNQLQTSVDLFFNLYRDMIIFTIDIPYRLGLPDIANSKLQFENMGVEANALGGETEVIWRPYNDLSLRCNVGIRYVADKNTGKRMPSEPVLRINLGGRYQTQVGLAFDLALHFVSEYEMPLIDPRNVFENPKQVGLGNELLMIGRIGYSLLEDEEKLLEIGLNIVTPLGSSFREYPGAPIPQWSMLRRISDWGGEQLTRLVSFYLRGSF
jgi:outer membrane receptor protein involved in Fe transport